MAKTKIVTLIIIFLTLATSSCRTSRVSQTQMQLVEYSLKKADLPGRWSIEGKGWGADYGGESYGITYIRDNLVFINHIVSIHSSEERAKQAYEEWETKWFSLLNFQPITSFSPSNLTDDYRYECEAKEPDDPLPYLKVCIYLQQHSNIISFVRISFDDRSSNNLTFTDVNDVLAILDKRLNE